jgi:hypothetical protein
MNRLLAGSFLAMALSLASYGASGELLLLTSVDSPAPPALVAAFEEEASTLLRPAGLNLTFQPLPTQVEWEDSVIPVSVHLRGDCADWRAAPMPSGEFRLAHVTRVDADIQPFVHIDCGAVAGYLADTLHFERGVRANRIWGRALARVLAHELYHFLIGTEHHHTQSGLFSRIMSRHTLTCTRPHFTSHQIQVLRNAFLKRKQDFLR